MDTGSSFATLIGAQGPEPSRYRLGSRCKCGPATGHTRPAAPPVAKVRRKRSVVGGALTLVGTISWLCVPKCPMCVATYVAIGSGITLSFAQSQILWQAMTMTATAMILTGVWRLWRYGRRTPVG